MMKSRNVAVVAALQMPLTAGAVSVDRDAHRMPEVIEAGETLYAEHCAACHGSNLEGEPDWQVRDAEGYLPAPPHDETGHTWHHPTAQLFEITKYGTEQIVGGGYKSRMLGFADTLDDDEILSILAYIKSTWPARILDHHDRLDAAYGNR